MKILVVGSGGREHAIAWKLARSERVEKIYAAPGNGGTASEKKCVNIPVPGGDPAAEAGQDWLAAFAKENGVGLAVAGPEAPLAAGIADRFRAAGIAVAGADKKSARLEASKIYAKAFMKKYGVRAAESRNFFRPEEALKYARDHFGAAAPAPLVIKADGLAAGKGVVIAEDFAAAGTCLSSFMKERSLGDAGASVVLEEFLEGTEVSVLAAVSASPGRKGVIIPFVSAKDHKRRFDGDRGPNTGGMGALAPAPGFTEEVRDDFFGHILEPTLKGIRAEGMDYRGFIFFGLMVQDRRCRLLEYNVRLGDPETQAVLPLMESDFADLCLAVAAGSLEGFPLKWKGGAVCAPAAVAEGYPGTYRKGDPIAVNSAALAKTGALVFFAGAERGSGSAPGSGCRTSGGRVLTVSAEGKDAGDASAKAYRALDAIHFEGMDFRRDIGT
jgi:phosphoribosylamine--glycine ligase